MNVAQPGLLQRLQQHGDQAAWGRLVDLYSPLLFLWACRAGLPGAEAGELVRQVFAVVAAKLPEFRSGEAGSFRAWLRSFAHAQRREMLLKRKVPVGGPAGVADPAVVPAEADGLWSEEYLPFLLRSAVDLLEGDFPPQEWKACQGVTIEGRDAADVARELGVDAPAVYAAEARVLKRLRQELDGLLDD